MTTESELREWRYGSTQAERLAAALLALDGHYDVTPQAPLGGADDRKDILSRRTQGTYLTAVYFPSTCKNFTDVSNKFDHDREGVQRHEADYFVFMTNQHLTLEQRARLKGRGSPSDEIYDLQRIVAILDSPPGYGLRLSHLRIQMTIEEQISFFDVLQGQVALHRNAGSGNEKPLSHEVAGRTLTLLDDIRDLVEASTVKNVVGNVTAPMSELTLASISLIHGAVARQPTSSFGLGGPFRAIPVWITDGSGKRLAEVCPPEEIVPKLKELLFWWRSKYTDLAANPLQESVIQALTEFHFRFSEIHPFIDDNGRMSRFLLNKACEELLHRRIDMKLAEKSTEYYEALSSAATGDMTRLQAFISAALL